MNPSQKGNIFINQIGKPPNWEEHEYSSHQVKEPKAFPGESMKPKASIFLAKRSFARVLISPCNACSSSYRFPSASLPNSILRKVQFSFQSSCSLSHSILFVTSSSVAILIFRTCAKLRDFFFLWIFFAKNERLHCMHRNKIHFCKFRSSY